MSYEKQIWEELPSEETPFSAERMNHIEEGIDSKLDKMVVSKSLNTAGWYRVAKYNVYGTFGKSFIINISTRYVNTNNMTASSIVNFINNKVKITNISSLIHNSVVDKIRVVRDNDEYFVEIHYAYNAANSVYVDIFNQHLHDTIKLSMLDFEAPTDTATVLDELAIEETTAHKVENSLSSNSTINAPSINAVNNGTARIIYSKLGSTGEYTFSSNGLYLVICHVNGNNLCTLDVVMITEGSLYKTSVKTSSQYLTLTYTDTTLKIKAGYTCIMKIVKLGG